jgi:hypothetical protein
MGAVDHEDAPTSTRDFVGERRTSDAGSDNQDVWGSEPALHRQSSRSV